MLPWKQAAKLYRSKYLIRKRKCERQRREIARLLRSNEDRKLYIIQLHAERDALRNACKLAEEFLRWYEGEGEGEILNDLTAGAIADTLSAALDASDNEGRE